MALQLIDIIILLAAGQGLLLAVLLFHKHGNLFATRFLGTLILLYSLILGHLIFNDVTGSTMYYSISPLIIGIGFAMISLHYLYAKYLVTSTRSMDASDWLHFLPFLIWELFWVIAFLTFPGQLHLWEFAIGSETVREPFILFHWLIIMQAVIYFFWTLRLLSHYAEDIKEVFSSLDQIRLDWLRYMSYLALLLVLGFFVENVFRLAGIDISHQFNFSSALLAIYVYAIGYLGLFKSEVFSLPTVADSIQYLPHHPQHQTADSQDEKYKKSGLDSEKAKRYEQQLLTMMEKEKPYQNSDLTLKELADRLSITPHNLSEVINTRLDKNFFDFINEYRLEQVKTDLGDPSKENLTILAIAYDAGFNSKSAFYSIFKKETGMTPSEYRRKTDHR